MDQLVAIPVDYLLSILGHGDERVREWPMVRSPLPTIGLCLSYVMFVKVIGPYLMRDRKPFDIRWLMVAYNFLMVGVSTYLFYKLGVHGWFGKYNYRCQPVDYSDSEDAIGMADIAWWYYISKFVEFADTVFFVLRKKYTHISNLHVIHHGILPMSVWWGVKFTPGGHSTFFAFVNSFVHILMYFYYGLSAIGPHMNKYLFWKKHMTSIQMVQFVMIFVHSFQLLFRECDYPKSFMWWIGFHAVLFWFLFWDFYKNTYLVRKNAAKGADKGDCKGKPSAFFACSQTESFLNGMNSELNGLSRRKGEKDSYSKSVKKGYTNGKETNGKDL
ncbi:putative protein for very long chain fatty acid elongation [Halotydeus destructor]|nr:putative protein for very long chain fatty acid elongation [Halotydeus destructor]